MQLGSTIKGDKIIREKVSEEQCTTRNMGISNQTQLTDYNLTEISSQS